MKTTTQLKDNCTSTGCTSIFFNYQHATPVQTYQWGISLSNRELLNPMNRLILPMAKRRHSPKEWLGKVENLVMDNLKDNSFGPTSLSRMLCLSPSQLYRKIKAASYLTPGGLIRNARLGKAKELLASCECSIAEVAYQVGFGDANYFSRTFHQTFGLTPSDYRRIHS